MGFVIGVSATCCLPRAYAERRCAEQHGLVGLRRANAAGAAGRAIAGIVTGKHAIVDRAVFQRREAVAFVGLDLDEGRRANLYRLVTFDARQHSTRADESDVILDVIMPVVDIAALPENMLPCGKSATTIRAGNYRRFHVISVPRWVELSDGEP